MGLEYRNGRPRYVEKERDGRRVVSRYVASGQAAIACAILAADTREERQEHRDARAELAAESRLIALYCQAIDEQTNTVLRAAGYHRPGRHPWRKKRNGNRG